jgi:hypothetical protein
LFCRDKAMVPIASDVILRVEDHARRLVHIIKVD